MTQVVLLNALAMSHSGEKRALEISEILQCVPIALARRKGIFEDVVTHERISQMQVPLQQIWQLWIMDEGRRRTGFGVWVCPGEASFDKLIRSLTFGLACRLRLPD